MLEGRSLLGASQSFILLSYIFNFLCFNLLSLIQELIPIIHPQAFIATIHSRISHPEFVLKVHCHYSLSQEFIPEVHSQRSSQEFVPIDCHQILSQKFIPTMEKMMEG